MRENTEEIILVFVPIGYVTLTLITRMNNKKDIRYS